MGGGGGPSYVSGGTSVAAGSTVWIVVSPVTSTTTWGIASTSYNFKVYVQPTRPTASDTPIVQDSVGQALFTGVRLFSYTGTSVIDDLKIEYVNTDQVDATAFPKKVPVNQLGWVGQSGYGVFCEDQQPGNTNTTMGNAYLGTDSVYTSKEDS